MHRASVASLGKKKTTNDVTVVLLRHSHRRTQLFCRVASGIWWPRTGIDRRNKSLALLSSTLLCVRCVRATLDFRGSLQIPARVSLARNTGVMVIMAAAPAAIAAATAVSICPLTAAGDIGAIASSSVTIKTVRALSFALFVDIFYEVRWT